MALQIPGYRVIRKINQGGMASVYLAIQISVGRVVALKVMSPQFNRDPDFSERFQREATIVGQLSHPNIVSIYDIGRHDGLNYIAMDYLPNGTVHERMAAGVSLEEALRITRELANALDHTHEKGYIHRDIKPENILFRANNSAVLSDFGVARGLLINPRTTQVGTVVGTAHYMSPEQTKGKPLDGRADLYSLGAVLFEMLTGSVPYPGDEAVSIALKHISAPIPRLPGHLSLYQPLVDRLLAKDPDQRFQRGSELATAIEELEKIAPQVRASLPSHPADLGVMPLLRALFSATGKSLCRRWQQWQDWRWQAGRGLYRASQLAAVQQVARPLDTPGELAITQTDRAQLYTHVYPSIKPGLPVANLALGFIVALGLSLGAWQLLGADSQAPLHAATPVTGPAPSSHAVAEKADTQLAPTSDSAALAEQSPQPQSQIHSQPQPQAAAPAATEPSPLNATAEATSAPRVEAAPAEAPEQPAPNQPQPAEEPFLELKPIPGLGAASSNHASTNHASTKALHAQANITQANTTDALTETAPGELPTMPAQAASASPTDSGAPLVTYTLSIVTNPADARVRIMNISQRYLPGLQLPAGRYDVEVSHPNYDTYRQWLELGEQSLTANVALKPRNDTSSEINSTLAGGLSGPAMVSLPAGSFYLGDKNDSQATPVIRISLPAFAIGKYEVSFREYDQFAQATGRGYPSDNKWGRGEQPVINVSYEDATDYAAWLSQQTGKRYRLPSEAEWEYAARGGSNTRFWWGDDEKDAAGRANCRRGCSSKFSGLLVSKTAPVGNYPANGFGVFDTAGNVSEWVQDCYRDNYSLHPTNGKPYETSNCAARAVRGGSAGHNAQHLASTQRDYSTPHQRSERLGFRVLLEL